MEKQGNLARKTLSVEEAAKVLGVGRGQAYQAVREGAIPSLRIGRRLLIPIKGLMEMIDGQPQDAA